MSLDPDDMQFEIVGSEPVKAGALLRAALVDVLETDEVRSGELRHLSGKHNQDSHGNDVSGTVAAGGLKDALRLAGRIDLDEGEQLAGSDKLSGDGGSVRLALVDRRGVKSLRLGIGGPGYGSRDDEAGPWHGGPDSTTEINADRKSLREQKEMLEEALGTLADDPGADPATVAKLQARLDELDDMELGDVDASGYTAKLDMPAAERLRRTLADALAAGAKQQAALDSAYDADEAEPERPAQGFWTLAEGSIPGEWADVHYNVYLDDPAVGVEVYLGAVPHDSGLDLDELTGSEQAAQFDLAETKKLLRLLGKYAAGETDDNGRSAVMQRAFQPGDHPRAPSGVSNGGQFIKDAGGQPAKKAPAKKAAPRKPTGTSGAGRPDNGTLGFDGKTGTGYGVKGGDPRVRKLQQALNRLGLTDAKGKKLAVDGKLGPLTTQAVKAVQKRLGLKADGRVTPALLQRLAAAKSIPARSALMDLCVRSYEFDAADSDGRTLEGYAAVFNSPTTIRDLQGDFEETILPGAFARTLRRRTPLLQWDHGKDPRIGTAPIGDIDELREDDHGLFVRARLYDHPDVERVRLAIKGGSVRGMSFRFGVPEGGDDWPSRDKRSIRDLDAYELGPVAFPAYDATSVSVRSLLAQLDPDEHRSLIRELAAELRLAVDLSDLIGTDLTTTDLTGASDAWSVDRGDDDMQPSSGQVSNQSYRQRLDDGALRARGILK